MFRLFRLLLFAFVHYLDTNSAKRYNMDINEHNQDEVIINKHKIACERGNPNRFTSQEILPLGIYSLGQSEE